MLIPRREHLKMSEDIFDCHEWGLLWHMAGIEAKDAAKQPTMCKKVSSNKELSHLKCK